MVVVRLKGVHTVIARGKEYHYAWRGGPRLKGSPGSPEFVASFNAAHDGRKVPAKGTLKELIAGYKASPAYTKLGAHTTRAYAKHLDAIEAKWGTTPLRIINDKRIKRHFAEWQDSMADRPRTADMAATVLKKVLKWGKSRALLDNNHAEDLERLHRVDKSDSIWTADELEALFKHASKELQWVVELALHTGLRQSDLIRLAWNHEKDGAFGYLTSKRKKFVTIPITPACRALLGRIERRGPVILSTQRGKRPWTADGLRSTFSEACRHAGVTGRTFHDLRRTAATNLLAAGVEGSQVAMIMGWAEDDVEAMKRKYVSRAAVVQAVLAKLEKGV